MHSSGIKQEKEVELLLREVYDAFRVPGTFLKGQAYGSGHIHDTFLVESIKAGQDKYIFQRLNNRVFHNIPQMQENIERVTCHIRNKLLTIPGSDIRRECLTFLSAPDGKTWITDGDGSYWRISLFIPAHRSYEKADTPAKAHEAGKAIGRFQVMLSDLPGRPLYETIPFFHHIGKRLETLDNKIMEDPADKIKFTRSEIDFIKERSEKMKIILRLGEEGKIPVRITHNDTKFNNILLDETDRALCVIDLDTVMPGYVHFDFGDAIRTAANSADEDEHDLSKIKMNIMIFRAFAEGYLSETRETLTLTEKEHLAIAPVVITFNQAVRFLTDYIDGDKYYKINHTHHNLQRTKAQLQLVRSMEEQYEEMEKIIAELI
jgi:Ser/Thr protein kinase RdoA (MazF antagonist)